MMRARLFLRALRDRLPIVVIGVVLLLVLLLAAACGDDTSADTEVTTTTTAAAASTEVATTTSAAATTTATPPEEGGVAEAPAIPADWLTYTHPDGWSVRYPPRGWRLEAPSGPDDSTSLVAEASAGELDPTLSFYVTTVAEPMTGSADYAAATRAEIATAWEWVISDQLSFQRGDLLEPFVVYVGDARTDPDSDVWMSMASFNFYDPDAEPPVGFTLFAAAVDLEDSAMVEEVIGVATSYQPPEPGFEASPSTGQDLIVYIAIEGNESFNIWTIAPDGSGARQLTDFVQATLPHWSPDRSQIAFHTMDGGEEFVWIMDADGGNQQQVTDFSSAAADWHPDGTSLIFNCDAFGEPKDIPDICWMEIGSDDVLQLIDSDETRDYDAHISPDGSAVVFTTDRNGGRDLYLLTVETGELIPLATGSVVEDMARWAPDDGLLWTVWLDVNNADLFGVTPANPDTIIAYTDAPGIDYMGDWSPDGQRIVFASDRGGNMDLWIVDADGGNLMQLTDTPDLTEGWPSW
jgi:hypothetical protein